jgi:AraC-like DNA-binding protein
MEISYRNDMAEDPPEIPTFAWQETRFEWLWAYRAASAKQEVWSAAADVPNGVFFVEKGRVDIEAHGRRFAVPAGAAFFSAPGPRRHFFAAGTRLLSAGFRCRRPDGLPLYAKGLNLVAPAARLRSLHRATVALYESLHGGRAAVDYHRAILPRPATLADRARRESAFFSWFAAYADALAKLGVHPAPGHRGGRVLDRIIGLLNDESLGRPSALPELAARAGYSRRRLDQLLQSGLGLTAKGFLEQRRLESARRLLGEGQLPLKEVAALLGFRHAPHFTTWFKAGSGRTPSAYRREASRP